MTKSEQTNETQREVQNLKFDIGDAYLLVDLPGWSQLDGEPGVLHLMSQESETVSIIIAGKPDSSLDEICPVMFGNIKKEYVSFILEQPVKSNVYKGLIRGYHGNVPELGGKVVFLYYCLQSGSTFIKLDFMIAPSTYERKIDFYQMVSDRFKIAEKP